MKRITKHLSLGMLALLAVALVAAGLFYRHTRSWLYAPIAAVTQPIVYKVPRGAALSSVLNDLRTQGWVQHPRELALWARYVRPGLQLKAGEYELRPGMSPVELLELLASGRVLLHKLTLVEGSTLREARQLLAAQTNLRIATRDWSDSQILAAVDQAAADTYPHPEGLFYPDTYRYARDTADLDILSLARERMRDELDKAWAGRDAGLPLASAYEALILASIVEKETALASERPMIAGVFIERLRRGMRLQTDPTIIYGLGAAFDGNLRRADLLRDGPYNTYTRAGLPPTPICLPSAAALSAAVHPQITGALFFVATGKGDGSHYFSRTLAEHNAALQRYLRTLRQRR